MRRPNTLPAVALVAIIVTACGSSASEPTSAAAPSDTSTRTIAPIQVSDVDFLADGSQQLDVFHPEDSGPWPVVVVVHGHNQERAHFTDLAEAIASQGAVAFNVDYLDRFPFVTAVDQVACAVRFARATGPRYGGAPDRVVLVAHSIGAFISMNVALTGDDHATGCAASEGSALPEAFVGYEGPYDLAERYHEGSGLDYRPLQADDPDLWHAINPYSRLGRHPDLVVRLIHGDWEADDRVYPTVADSIAFRDLLVGAGYDAELTVVEGALHGSVHRKGEAAFEIALRDVLELTSR
jgi:acetyl esterase/lipase